MPAGREDHGSIGAVDDGRLNELAQRYVLLELAFAKKGEAVAGEHGGAIIRDGLWTAPVMPLEELCPGMENPDSVRNCADPASFVDVDEAAVAVDRAPAAECNVPISRHSGDDGSGEWEISALADGERTIS